MSFLIKGPSQNTIRKEKKMEIKEYLKPVFSSPQEPPKVRVKKDPNISVRVSGVDFFVTKTTSKAKKTLVVLMSQNLLYIREENTGVDRAATPELVRSFLGTTDITLADDETNEECVWLSELNKGKSSAEWLCSLFDPEQQDDITVLLKKGYAHVLCSAMVAGWWKRSSIIPGAEAYLPAIFKRVPDEYKKDLRLAFTWHLRNMSHMRMPDGKTINIPTFFVNKSCFHQIDTTPGWGISGFCDFVEAFFRSAATQFPSADSMKNVLGKKGTFNTELGMYVYEPRLEVPRTKLQSYLFYNGVEECGEDALDAFTKEYGDYLNVRDQLKEVTNKKYPVFPENLYSSGQRISAVHRKYVRELEKVSDEEFEEYVKSLGKYEYMPENSPYIIVTPKSKSDMLDEAVHQCNCLSSYISRVSNGELMVFFCRRKQNPTRSFVTISVSADGTLGQVLAARNREPERGAKEFVEKWHEKFFQNQN